MKRILVKLLGVLAVGAALNLQPATALAQGAGYTLLTTFTNPTPLVSDWFGTSVAVLGTDRVLIGCPYDNTRATDAGAAYLFSINGTLLSTFLNPRPVAYEYFGYSVAGVGSDLVLIGAYGYDSSFTAFGIAYLFRTNGALFCTLQNPRPAYRTQFGISLTAVGTDRVLIGSPGDPTGANQTGAAYLFSTNGALLVTITNPTPAYGDNFGSSVAALGADRVLIGAPNDNTGGTRVGAAYLFDTGGNLLTTFTNPTPAYTDWFGHFVAGVGADRVLIGVPYDDRGASNAGVAYLFGVDGVLLTTFTNPTPAVNDYFGYSAAVVGSNRILIGADHDDAAASDAGVVYLFNTNGTLLTTITNPAPSASDYFGCSVVAVGADRVMVGTYGEDMPIAGEAGVAYLFNLVDENPETPSLTIRLTSTNTLAVSWPSVATGWKLQENANGVASVNWSNVTSGIQDDGTNKALLVNPPTGSRFYRLFKP